MNAQTHVQQALQHGTADHQPAAVQCAHKTHSVQAQSRIKAKLLPGIRVRGIKLGQVHRNAPPNGRKGSVRFIICLELILRL